MTEEQRRAHDKKGLACWTVQSLACVALVGRLGLWRGTNCALDEGIFYNYDASAAIAASCILALVLEETTRLLEVLLTPTILGSYSFQFDFKRPSLVHFFAPSPSNRIRPRLFPELRLIFFFSFFSPHPLSPPSSPRVIGLLLVRPAPDNPPFLLDRKPFLGGTLRVLIDGGRSSYCTNRLPLAARFFLTCAGKLLEPSLLSTHYLYVVRRLVRLGVSEPIISTFGSSKGTYPYMPLLLTPLFSIPRLTIRIFEKGGGRKKRKGERKRPRG